MYSLQDISFSQVPFHLHKTERNLHLYRTLYVDDLPWTTGAKLKACDQYWTICHSATEAPFSGVPGTVQDTVDCGPLEERIEQPIYFHHMFFLFVSPEESHALLSHHFLMERITKLLVNAETCRILFTRTKLSSIMLSSLIMGRRCWPWRRGEPCLIVRSTSTFCDLM